MKEENKSEVSIEELINVFQEIDNRIKLLHKDSSDVFLQLNSFLKDYHKKYGIITGNVNRIFDAIVGKEGKGLIEEFDQVYCELLKYKNTAESEYHKSFTLIKQLKSKIKYLLVVLRNFKQDLTTLRFLTTNYRLLSNSGNFDTGYSGSVMRWESVANRIKEGLSFINREFEEIATKAEIILAGLDEFTGESLKTIYQYNDDLKSTNELINRKNQESKFHFPVLKEKMDNSRNSIGNIITHIQYHDIIRQKIEHIQTTHQKIIGDLEKNATEKGDETQQKDRRFSMISDITGLQSAQLILISKEYQKALEVISQNFQNITSDLTSVSRLSNEFSQEGEDSETTLVNRVRNRMDKGVMMMDSFNFASFDREIALLIRSIKKVFSETSSLILEPVDELNSLFIDEKESSLKNKKFDNSSPNLVYQLSSLIRDIVDKRNDLELDMTDISGLIEEYERDWSKNEIGSELEREQIKIMVSITRMLNRLDDENKELDELLSQNYCLNSDIVSKLQNTVEQADYYELFDKVLIAVIEKLNSINQRLGSGNREYPSNDNIDKLKEIEALYTVASERKVHDNVVSGKNDEDIAEEENEDDVELF